MEVALVVSLQKVVEIAHARQGGAKIQGDMKMHMQIGIAVYQRTERIMYAKEAAGE